MLFQVPPAELEQLLQSIPEIADAAVIPLVLLPLLSFCPLTSFYPCIRNVELRNPIELRKYVLPMMEVKRNFECSCFLSNMQRLHIWEVLNKSCKMDFAFKEVTCLLYCPATIQWKLLNRSIILEVRHGSSDLPARDLCSALYSTIFFKHVTWNNETSAIKLRRLVKSTYYHFWYLIFSDSVYNLQLLLEYTKITNFIIQQQQQ